MQEVRGIFAPPELHDEIKEAAKQILDDARTQRGCVKTREEAARFIETQLAPDWVTSLEKGEQFHYGKQELRELMDFIYGGPPEDKEMIDTRKK